MPCNLLAREGTSVQGGVRGAALTWWEREEWLRSIKCMRAGMGLGMSFLSHFSHFKQPRQYK
jgi:hypothetical protein